MKCGGCETTLEAFLSQATDPREAWQWLVRHGVVRETARCESCGRAAVLEAARLRFRCRRLVRRQPGGGGGGDGAAGGRCEYVRSARAGTWCGNSTASVPQICRFCAAWLLAGGGKARLTAETAFSSETVARWLRYCREVLVGWAVLGARRVGGPGRVVEVEAAPVRRRRLSRFCELRAAWAVAGVEPASGRAFLVPLARRADVAGAVAATLRAFVRPGSALASGLWAAGVRPRLHDLPGVSFVPRDAEAERAWRQVLGGSVPRYRGRCRRLYVGHLAEFLFVRAFPPPKRLHSFFSQVGRLFPPPP